MCSTADVLMSSDDDDDDDMLMQALRPTRRLQGPARSRQAPAAQQHHQHHPTKQAGGPGRGGSVDSQPAGNLFVRALNPRQEERCRTAALQDAQEAAPLEPRPPDAARAREDAQVILKT